jgi:phosphatidylinositol kinase/protein kinase (PI-3  family)
MVDGFGVTGTDGVFFKCAELTLKMLRENKESLMSVLEAFVHDPLVEWTKRGSSNARASSNFKPVDAPEQGRRVLKNIANKLDGGMGLTHQLSTLIALPSNKSGNIHSVKEALFQTAQGLSDTGLQVSKRLGLEAQVVELIETATNQTFLSQMWIGWSSFY